MNILFINMLNGNFKKKSLQSVTEVHLVLDVSTRVENVHMMNSVTILTVHVWMDVIQDITDPNAQSVKYALDIQSIFIKRTFRKTAYWFIAYTEKKPTYKFETIPWFFFQFVKLENMALIVSKDVVYFAIRLEFVII